MNTPTIPTLPDAPVETVTVNPSRKDELLALFAWAYQTHTTLVFFAPRSTDETDAMKLMDVSRYVSTTETETPVHS